MNMRTSYLEEFFSVLGVSAVLAVAGCSSLNANRGNESALAKNQNTPVKATHAQAEVGLPGVIESASAPTVKSDSTVSQAQFAKPSINNTELQQKFNNLQNRFQTSVDRSQEQVNQSIMNAQEQAKANLQRTEATLEQQATQLQNQAATQAQKTQAAAQSRYNQLQNQAQKRVVAPIQQSAQKVDASLNQAAKSVGDATNKATQATGKFLDSLLPDTNPGP